MIREAAHKFMFQDSLKKDLVHAEELPILAIRTGDTLSLEKWTSLGDLSVPTYAVALFEAPPLAELGVYVSPICRTTATVVAGISVDGWGWIPTDANMKNMVSDLLEDAGARPGEWFKLTITYTNPLAEVGR
jgi:hypothetical protein